MESWRSDDLETQMKVIEEKKAEKEQELKELGEIRKRELEEEQRQLEEKTV